MKASSSALLVLLSLSPLKTPLQVPRPKVLPLAHPTSPAGTARAALRGDVGLGLAKGILWGFRQAAGPRLLPWPGLGPPRWLRVGGRQGRDKGLGGTRAAVGLADPAPVPAALAPGPAPAVPLASGRPGGEQGEAGHRLVPGG